MYKGTDQVLRLISKESMTIAAISGKCGLNEDSVRRIAEALKGEGYAAIETAESVHGVPTSELEGYVSQGFPEASVFKKAVSGSSVAGLTQAEKSIGIRWARVKGFVTVEGGMLVPEKSPGEVESAISAMIGAVSEIKKTGRCG